MAKVNLEPDGMWQREPDSDLWVDPDTGLICRLSRHPDGRIWGCVQVPNTHPDAADHPKVRIHGGYLNLEKRVFPEYTQIWFKAEGYAPSIISSSKAGYYFDWEYMREQCRQLALQLATGTYLEEGV